MKQLDLYFSDLNEEGKQKVLELYEIEDSKELNMDMDIIPLVTLEYESKQKETSNG